MSGRRVFLGFIYAGAIGVLIQKWTSPINTATTFMSFALPIYITTDYLARSESWNILSSEMSNFGLIMLTLLEVTGLFALAVFAKSMMNSKGISIDLYNAWPIYIFAAMNLGGNYLNIRFIRSIDPHDYASICIFSDMSRELEIEDNLGVWQARLTDFTERRKSQTISHAIDCKTQVQGMERLSTENVATMFSLWVRQRYYESVTALTMFIERVWYQFFSLHFLFLNAVFFLFIFEPNFGNLINNVNNFLRLDIGALWLSLIFFIFCVLSYLIKSLYELSIVINRRLFLTNDIFDKTEIQQFLETSAYMRSLRSSKVIKSIDTFGNLSLLLAFILSVSWFSTSTVIIWFLAQTFFVSFSVLAFAEEE